MRDISLYEVQELVEMIHDKFFRGAYLINVEDGGDIGEEAGKIIIKMPHYSDHRVELPVWVCSRDLDADFDDSLYQDREKLKSSRYIRLLEQVSTDIINVVGEWIINEQTTQDNHAFLKYIGIFTDSGRYGFHQDENDILQIAQVMLICSKDKSFRIHFDKSMPVLSGYQMSEVKDAEAAYLHIMKEYQMDGNGISIGHYRDVKNAISLMFSFCSPKGVEVKVPIYRNEFLHELKTFKGTSALCYSQTIKKYLFEKVVDEVQQGKLDDEDKSFFIRRLMMMQENK